MQQPKVLFIMRHRGPISVNKAQIELVVELKNKGVDIAICGLLDQNVTEYFDSKGIAVFHLFPKKSIDKNFIVAIKELILKEGFNTLHVLRGKELRNICIALKNKPKVKIIAYIGSVSVYWYDPTTYLTYLNPRVNAIICNSQFVYEHVTKQLPKSKRFKTTRIYKSYHPDWFNTVDTFDYTTLGIPKTALVIGMAATFMKVKGIPYWIEAIKNVKTNKEVHFVLFGSKTNSIPAQKMIEKHPKRQNIHLLGMRNDALSLIKGLDMYTQTSISEGFGRAVSEALILGKPIVMTNAGGCTELIDESCGIVVPIKDAKAIAKAWSLLINDDQLRKNMSLAANDKIHKDFHFDTMVTDTISLYQKLVKNA